MLTVSAGKDPVGSEIAGLTVTEKLVNVVAPRLSVVVTVNVSVPVVAGVPVIEIEPDPLEGTLRPGIAFWMLLTASETAPVPPSANIDRLYAILTVSPGNVPGSSE